MALPVPAMSKAVPWSTEVRMMGSPMLTLTPLVERQQLHRDVPLVMVHRHHDVELALDRAQKDRIRRLGVGHVQAARAGRLDGGDDLARFVVAEQPALRRRAG